MLQVAQSLDNPLEQAANLNRCMEGLTPEMAAGLLASLEQEDLKSVAAQRLFDHWASANPALAADWANNQDESGMRDSFLNTAALRWAVADLAAATTWARNFPEGELRTTIMTAVGSEAVRIDPLEALRLVAGLPPGREQEDLICRAAAGWAIADRDGVLSWAKTIEDPDLCQRVIRQIVEATAEQDPVKSASVALQDLKPGDEQDRAILSIVQHWVRKDPQKASAWVGQFPEDRLGQVSVENLVRLWADEDLVASREWLSTLPPGALRDSGGRAYSQVSGRFCAGFTKSREQGVPQE